MQKCGRENLRNSETSVAGALCMEKRAYWPLELMRSEWEGVEMGA